MRQGPPTSLSPCTPHFPDHHPTHHDDQQTLLWGFPRRLPSTARSAKGRVRPSSNSIYIHTWRHSVAKPRSRHHHHSDDDNDNTHNKHQSTVAISRPNHRISAVNRPLPAHETARAPLQPLYLAQSSGIPHTWSFTPEPPWVGQFLRGLPRGHGRREVVHWRPNRDW